MWVNMAFFGKMTGGVVCPVCGENLDRKPNMGLHNLSHVIPAEDGAPGFMWRCGCGDYDGVWDQKAGAAAGLTIHMQRRHQIQAF